MDSNKNIILEPSQYHTAVHHFQKFFSISEGPSDLDFLKEILSYFSRFPYENISKIIKYHSFYDEVEKIRLPGEVMEDHKNHHLGGTCFSLTYFLQIILNHRGFRCYPVMADMRWGKNVHCALVVVLDKRKYLVDPGYLLNQPMEVNTEKPRLYKTEFSGVELVFRKESREYNLYTFDKAQVKWRYRFRDRAVPHEEFLNHWLSSFEWNSMHGLCLTKVEGDKMIYVHKTFMRETGINGKKNFNIKKNYHAAIEEAFGIDQQLVEEALAALEANMVRERELGLWVPKKEWRPML